MPERSSSPTVHSPTSVSTLLSIIKDHPQAQLFAGGTYILAKQPGHRLSFPKHVIYLKGVDELSRIHRTERFLEIGSCASLNRLLYIGKHLLPKPIFSALYALGTPSIRNLATLGGNLGASDTRLSAFPVCAILAVHAELRKPNSQRWIATAKLHDPDVGIEPGEVITRIRIPFEPWDIHAYKRIGSPIKASSESISFCGAARIQKGTLSDFRYALGSFGPFIHRNSTIEAFLVGRKLPLPKREIDNLVLMISEEMKSYKMLLSDYQRTCGTNLFHWFITSLRPD